MTHRTIYSYEDQIYSEQIALRGNGEFLGRHVGSGLDIDLGIGLGNGQASVHPPVVIGYDDDGDRRQHGKDNRPKANYDAKGYRCLGTLPDTNLGSTLVNWLVCHACKPLQVNR